MAGRPLLIAHRGASGECPEHTLEAYRLAIAQGADYIEPDLVMTRDGVLVARHENEIGSTTDVASHPEFAARRRRQPVDGVEVEGWFVEDFTLAELKRLRARERLPQLRPGSALYDGQFAIPTFAEILQLLGEANRERRHHGLPAVGVYPETKHSSHFAGLGLALEGPLVAQLESELGDAPVFIQSFETGNLRHLHRLCPWPLVQLVELAGGPWDLRDTPRSYDALCTPEGLAGVAGYAAAVGVHKQRVLPRRADGSLAPATALVREAHEAGLAVHAWTFRAENEFLPREFRRGRGAADHGRLEDEIAAHVAAGVDGLFCDHPALARAALGPR